MSIASFPYQYPYETVAAGQTAQVLGGTGATGLPATGTVTMLTSEGVNCITRYTAILPPSLRALDSVTSTLSWL